MGFEQFLGNERIVTSLRGMLATERVPSAIAFLGPRGIGKYTLARMFAQAANCERLRDDFCGECETCKRIALLAEPSALVERGLAERGEIGDAEKNTLILQTHPDVWAIVPDPDAAEYAGGASGRLHMGAIAGRWKGRRGFVRADGGAYFCWMARTPCGGTSQIYF